AIADAVEIAPDDARLLPLRVKISAEHYEGTSQSGANLLAQCAQARKTVPDTEDPIGYLLCGEAALGVDAAGSRLVALNCARAAIGAFPHANLPRQLELRALLKLGRPAEAATAAEQIIRTIVPDAETLRLAITATRAAGEPLRSLARLAMPRVTSSHELQAELLRIALEDAPATAVQFLTDDMTAPDARIADRTLAVRALSACGQIDAAHAQLMATSPQREEESRELVLGAFSAWLVARSKECDDATLRQEASALNDHLRLAVGPQTALLETIPALSATHPLTAFELLELSLAAAAPSERTGALFLLAGDLALTAGDYTRAEARWTAALGFTGADAVAERLTRLLVLQGDLTRAARVYRLVDSVDDAALASLMGRPADAAAALARQLQQDPADLLAHATLAIFGQPAMVDWAAPTDPTLMTARLELISGLREPRLSALTLPRAEALLRAAPSKSTHQLLVARASADAGLGADAAEQHRGLFARGERTPVLLREVAYASDAEGYESTPAIDARITAGITEGTLGGSPLTVAYAADRIVSIFEAGGFAEQANAARLSQWLATPTARPWEPADLQLITTGHRPAEACYILDQILRGPHAGDAAPLLEAFYELAPASITATPKSLATLRAMALGHLRRVGPRAAIVRFLLEHGADKADLNVTDMLLDHLRRIAAGDDDRSCLDLAVERLIERLGQPETATRIDALLDEFPTSIALWSLRSRIGEQLTDGLEILDGMRRVLSHADDPQAELAFFAIAAKNHGLTAQDAARLAALPAALRESGDGQYVDALFSLRFGDPSAAAATLAKAAPRPDGAHLYFGAMAELMRADGAPDGRAKALLEQLQRDYPKSSLARHAGSFIRQLSPR
ncbi:MAG: hypothetical protein VYA51_12415, partial [Planctomycetota bacterium]|nr:hypothetical protein [Planctomycetota bacterium]